MAKFLNGINNAIRSFNSLGGGLAAAPSLDIIGANIPFAPLISFRDYFLDNFNQWTNSIPLNTQFIILIDRYPPALTTETMRRLEPIQNNGFDIDIAASLLTQAKNQLFVGCIFANGFQVGSESLGVSEATIDNNRGFIPGTILENRAGFSGNQLQVFFRETNTSFTDVIMRPWLIAASHYGYVARNFDDPVEARKDMKCNITILQYTRSDKGLSQIPRKTWRFYNCIPTSLDSRTYDHGDDESAKNFNVGFCYDKYEVSNNLYLSVEQLIKSINPFGF
jgi:hypothetical protein|tara:strand:- start:1683 stop:2519 length:837 start_codon:yes stop_codon:yes gene_type:complete